jgi:hypothetical protein
LSASWTEEDREAAYTSLCEAVTQAGPAREALFLARLALLLAEQLADRTAFEQALAAAVFGHKVEVPDPLVSA